MITLESAMLSYLLNALWQAPLLFGAGWLAVRMLRAAGPAAQHRAWVVTALLQSLLPASSLISTEWLRNLFPWSTHEAAASGGGISVVTGPAFPVGVLHLPGTLLVAIEILYVSTTAYFLLRFLWRAKALSTLRQGTVEITLPPPAAQLWQRCSTSFAVRNAALAASPTVSGPVTLGVRRPLILLPTAMVGTLEPEDLQTVLAHEFAHMHRQDFLKNLVYELISLPVRFHPFVQLVRNQLIESREMVCDQMAAEITGRRTYAQSLLRLASLLATGTPVRTPHAIGIFDANTFERRLMKLTQQQYEIRGVRRFALQVACIALAVATCGSALALRTNVDASATTNENKTPSASTDPTKVAPEFMAGNLLNKVTPHYPEEAKKAKIEGAVQLKALIGKDGTIENLQVISGPKELIRSALDAVRQWTYKPYLLNGDPQEVETTITVHYSLAP
jgi:TonB family protein